MIEDWVHYMIWHKLESHLILMMAYNIANVYLYVLISNVIYINTYNVWEVYQDYVVMCLVLESLTNVDSCCSGIIPKN